MTTTTLETLRFIISHKGCTQKDVLANVFGDVRNRNYGRVRPASHAIAELREKGYLVDDCERCECCGRAARGRRNVKLYATRKGAEAARKSADTEQAA